jgi:hypothetical protein
MLEKELHTFEEKLPELIKTDLGKFVLIKDVNVCGTFTAREDALKHGYQKFNKDAFFVRQILPGKQVLDFSNNQFVV